MKHRDGSYVAVAITASLLLSACAGGTQNALPSVATPSLASVRDSAPSPIGVRASGKAGVAVIVVHWPKRSTQRRPGYISPSTKSVVIEAVPARGKTITKIVDANGSASTTVRIDVPTGREDFYVSAYDRAQKPGGSPAGNELGQAEVTKTIHAGTNDVNFTIDGIVAAVGVALGKPSYMAELGGDTNRQQLVLIGDAASAVVLTPLDADGNAIVAPGVVPTVSLKAGYDSATGITITQQKKNAFLVSTNGPSANGTFGLIATATDGLGNSVATNVSVLQSQAIYVGYGSGSGARIAVYDDKGTPVALPASAFSGITAPVALSYDSDDRTVFVADASGKVLAFDGAGNRLTSFAAPTVAGVTSIAYFNAFIQGIPSDAIANPKRLIVGGTSSLTEYDATSGAQLVRATLPYTPTAVAGSNDPYIPLISPQGWLVFAGDPAGSVDPYDLPTLAPYASDNLPTHGEIPAGFGWIEGMYSNPFGFELLEDVCVDRGSTYTAQALALNCLYFVTGSDSHVARFSNTPGNFGQAGLKGTFNQVRESGTLAAVAIDPLHLEAAIVKSDQNVVEEYAVNDTYSYQYGTENFGFKPRLTFTTPSSLGLSKPNSIAVEW